MRTVVSGVRSSCDTSETNRRCTRERSSSRRIWLCSASAIELKLEPSRAISSSPLTVRRSSRRPLARRAAVRAAARTGSDDLPRDQAGDEGEQADEQQPGDGGGAPHQAQRLALGGEREHVEEPVVAAQLRQAHRRADDERPLGRALGHAREDVRRLLAGRRAGRRRRSGTSSSPTPPELKAPPVPRRADEQDAVVAAGGPPGEVLEDVLEPADLLGLGELLGQQPRVALERQHARARLAERRAGLGLDEAAADRLEQQGDEQRDDEAGHHERREHDAGLQRAAPAVPRGPAERRGSCAARRGRRAATAGRSRPPPDGPRRRPGRVGAGAVGGRRGGAGGQAGPAL